MGDAIAINPNTPSVSVYSDAQFKAPPSDMRFTRSYFMPHSPETTLSKAQNVLFTLKGWSNSTEFNLSDIMMELHFKMTGPQDGKPKSNYKLGPCAGIINSIFSDCKMYINDKPITASSNLTPYKGFFQTLMNYDEAARNTYLRQSGFILDDYTYADDGSMTNYGFINRLNPHVTGLVESGTFDYTGLPVRYYGKPTTDFSQDRVRVGPNISVKYDFTISKKDFFLQGEPGAEGDFEITNCTLWVPCGVLSAGLALENARRLKTSPYLINFTRSEISTYTIPSMTNYFLSENVFSGNQIPNRCCLVVLPTQSYLGDINESPYRFSSYTKNGAKIESVECSLNGESIDKLPNDMDMDYIRLFLYSGYMKTYSSNGITFDQFKEHLYMVLFDFSTSLDAAVQGLRPTIRIGTTRVSVRFDRSPQSDLSVLLYKEYSSTITINDKFQVSTNFLT